MRLRTVASRMLRPYEQHTARAAGTLEALSPLKVLSRGYALVRDADGHVVSSAADLAVGDEVDMLLGTGSARAQVTQVSKES